MFARKYRIKKDREFELYRKAGRVWMSKYAKWVILSPALTGFQLGFVIGKKTDKRAVVRNRIRRRMSEAVRVLWKKTPLLNTGILLIPKRESIEIKSTEMVKDFEYIWKELIKSDEKNNTKTTEVV